MVTTLDNMSICWECDKKVQYVFTTTVRQHQVCMQCCKASCPRRFWLKALGYSNHMVQHFRQDVAQMTTWHDISTFTKYFSAR
jgi:recombinational DNA repair protein (RecF pathway)